MMLTIAEKLRRQAIEEQMRYLAAQALYEIRVHSDSLASHIRGANDPGLIIRLRCELTDVAMLTSEINGSSPAQTVREVHPIEATDRRISESTTADSLAVRPQYLEDVGELYEKVINNDFVKRVFDDKVEGLDLSPSEIVALIYDLTKGSISFDRKREGRVIPVDPVILIKLLLTGHSQKGIAHALGLSTTHVNDLTRIIDRKVHDQLDREADLKSRIADIRESGLGKHIHGRIGKMRVQMVDSEFVDKCLGKDHGLDLSQLLPREIATIIAQKRGLAIVQKAPDQPSNLDFLTWRICMLNNAAIADSFGTTPGKISEPIKRFELDSSRKQSR